jgi:hypothetical protein
VAGQFDEKDKVYFLVVATIREKKTSIKQIYGDDILGSFLIEIKMDLD